MLADLLAHDGVEETCEIRGRVGVMALHGGIEEGTAELAVALALRSEVSRYAVVQPESLWWHVPSIYYDPAASPALAAFLDHVRVSVSIHGFGRPGQQDLALIGGRNRDLAAELAGCLRAAGVDAIDDLERIPTGLRGMHASNPVNLASEGGVQVELGSNLRDPDSIDRIAGAMAPLVSDWIAG